MPDLKTELSKVPAMALSTPKAGPAPAVITRSQQTCSPIFLRKLTDEVGLIAEVGRMLGLSPSGIATSLGRDKVSVVTEIAAKLTLQEIERKKAGKSSETAQDRVVLARVPSSKWAALKTVADAMGIDFKEV
jgi:hypothetical protein